MSKTNFNELLEAGAHFGHLKRKWNPAMAPYIFTEKNGIHIIDLNKTVVKIDEASAALKQIARSGKKILFVATKKQAKDVVAEKVKNINMPYVTERWPGGMLTNFATIRKAVRKMATIDKMATDGTFENISKKEKLQISRQRAKMEIQLGSITDLTRLPAALFIVDISKEHIAVAEAKRLNIPTFGIVDTNSDPNLVDYAIPANDDATTSISLIISTITKAIEEGLSERKVDKEAAALEEKEGKITKETRPRMSDDADGDGSTERRARRTAAGPRKTVGAKNSQGGGHTGSGHSGGGHGHSGGGHSAGGHSNHTKKSH
ncbi:MAG: 30S ribosomal protein S2 [Bacteroidia bacterium]